MFTSTSSSSRELLSTNSASAAQVVPVAQGLNDGLSQVRSLSRSSAPGTTANNSFAGATNLGNLNSVRRISDSVGSFDTQDYYRFTLSGNRLNVALTGLSADADVRVYNAAGTQIAVSARGGTADDSINLSGLTSGATYFVRVNQFSGNTNYSLRLSNSSPNDLITSEVNVGNLAGVRNFSDSVNNGDTSDIYRFSLGTTSNVTARLSGLSADADVRIIRDRNGNGVVDAGEEIVRSAAGGSASEFINLQGLGAGNYIAQVYQFSGSTNYNLQLTASAGRGFAPEPNNTLGQAYNIGTLNGFRQFAGSVSTTDTSDFYRFNVGVNSNVSINLSGLTADADIRLFNSAGTLVASSTAGGTTPDNILRNLAAGSYSVQVSRFSGAPSYTLSLSA
jgi:hypothetical protein